MAPASAQLRRHEPPLELEAALLLELELLATELELLAELELLETELALLLELEDAPPAELEPLADALSAVEAEDELAMEALSPEVEDELELELPLAEEVAWVAPPAELATTSLELLAPPAFVPVEPVSAPQANTEAPRRNPQPRRHVRFVMTRRMATGCAASTNTT